MHYYREKKKEKTELHSHFLFCLGLSTEEKKCIMYVGRFPMKINILQSALLSVTIYRKNIKGQPLCCHIFYLSNNSLKKIQQTTYLYL